MGDRRGDQAHIDLVGEQVALIEQVGAVNPKTIVVLQTGSPVSMPWLDRVAGVIPGLVSRAGVRQCHRRCAVWCRQPLREATSDLP